MRVRTLVPAAVFVAFSIACGTGDRGAPTPVVAPPSAPSEPPVKAGGLSEAEKDRRREAWRARLEERADDLAVKADAAEATLAEKEATYKRRTADGLLDGPLLREIEQLKKEVPKLWDALAAVEGELAAGPPDSIFAGADVQPDDDFRALVERIRIDPDSVVKQHKGETVTARGTVYSADWGDKKSQGPHIIVDLGRPNTVVTAFFGRGQVERVLALKSGAAVTITGRLYSGSGDGKWVSVVLDGCQLKDSDPSQHAAPSQQTATPLPSRPAAPAGKVHVNGYYRKDGTYVKSHLRSSPRR